MRTLHFALASLLLACFFCFICTPSAPAADAGAAADKDKDKPKEKPFKYDAWCVFSDLAPDRPYIPPNAPIDPESEHSRPGSEKLGGFGRRGQWAHVVLDLKNTTDPKDKIVYKGDATIVLNHYKPSDTSMTTYGTTYRQSFVVAPQSEKQYHFSVYCPEDGWNERLNLEIDTDNGRQFFRDFHLRDLDQRNEELIVVVSDQPGAFKYLGPVMKNLNDPDAMLGVREQTGRQIASVTPSELPTRWHDLALASLIIIDGPPAGGLSPDQWDALRAYAQSGGKIMLMAGKDPARLKGPAEELAGITVRGSAEVATLDSFSFPFPAPTEKNKDLRLPIIEVTASANTGLVKRNVKTQMIELCAKSYGAGMVTFLPFSLSDKLLEHWPDRSVIPLSLIRAEKNLFVVDSQDDNDVDPSTVNQPPYNRGNYNPRQARQTTLSTLRNALDTSFSNDTPVITQSRGTVLSFMLIYLACAVPLNYGIFLVLRRREAAWLMAPLWALGFTIVAYYVGYSGQTGVVTINEVSVIEAGPGQGTGVGRTFMGVYAPRRNDYQIVFPGMNVGGEAYDTEAAPGHLVNTVNVETRDAEFPTMRLREDGQDVAIESILILQRSTRRFEIQHRAWLNRGLDLKFAAPNGDQAPRPQIRIQNNTGRTLYNPIFIKGGEYVEIAANSSAGEFEAGQIFDSSTQYQNWHGIDDKMIEKLTARFGMEGGSQHTANRAQAVTNYLKTHMKQYAAGVFVAWADGASLPVRIGATGAKAADPNLEGITLLVVPAQASNRGGRAVSLKKNPPVAQFATAFNPEDRNSGEWKKCDKISIPIKTPDEQNKKCVYLRLLFDPEYGQYVYEGKAVQITFNLTNKPGRGAAPFNGVLSVSARMDGATKKSERFKELAAEAIAGMRVGATQRIKTLKFQFSDTENFTGPAIILKIQPVADEGTPQLDNLVIDRVDLQLIDR